MAGGESLALASMGRTRWRPLWHGLGGAGFGFFVLHPLTMVVFRWLDPRLAPATGDGRETTLLEPILHSFRAEMAPMGVVFGFFCAALALLNDHYRGRLRRQLAVSEAYREELGEQARLLRAQNERLAQLERSNRRHMQFMVHDFKTHLASILGSADLLLGGKESRARGERTEELTRIRRQALRMAGAVRDLLDFAHPQDAPSLHRERISPSKLIARAVADLSLPLHLGRVEAGDGAGSCPDVSVDVRLVERILVNLAFNALKHNRAGTRVMLDARPGTREVAFTCTDDGRGLPPAVAATLFSEKPRCDAVDSYDEDSTGLGLAFCKAAVEAHGGRIEYEAVEGPGARFLFTIPLISEEGATDGKDEATDPRRG